MIPIVESQAREMYRGRPFSFSFLPASDNAYGRLTIMGAWGNVFLAEAVETQFLDSNFPGVKATTYTSIDNK